DGADAGVVDVRRDRVRRLVGAGPARETQSKHRDDRRGPDASLDRHSISFLETPSANPGCAAPLRARGAKAASLASDPGRDRLQSGFNTARPAGIGPPP